MIIIFKYTKKLISFLSAVIILVITAVPFSVQAASESTLRNSVVSIAENEIGYTGTSSYSKYGDWYGYQGSWCTTFVFWCFNEAGSDNGVKLLGTSIPNGGNCNSMISWFSNKDRYYKRSSGYTPKAGDLVFFDWSGNGSSQHVGIVTGTSGSTVYTVEGNCSGKVKSRTYTSSGSKPYNNISAIMGYGVPSYSSSSSSGGQAPKTTKRNSTTKAHSNYETTKRNNQQNTSSSTTAKNNETTTEKTTKEKTTEAIKLDSLDIHASNYDLQIGDTIKLNYSVEPSDAPAVVGYFCDEEGIIEIGNNGDIKAIGSGTATVVVCANNELYKQCDFTVTEAVAQVTTKQVKERKVVGTTQTEIVTTEKNVQTVLTHMGMNINELSQNRQLYIIPLTIIAVTFFISVFVALAKRVKQK